MKFDSSQLPALLDDLDAAVREFESRFATDAAGWTRGPAGKWTPGQHADHLAKILTLSTGEFEQAVETMRQGRLGPRPRRGLLQGLMVWMLTREPFPRGGKALPIVAAGPTPEFGAVFALIREGAARHRTLADRLTPQERDRLWIRNPFAPKFRWHYRLPEMVRVHATHTRHHLRLAMEAAAATTRSPRRVL